MMKSYITGAVFVALSASPALAANQAQYHITGTLAQNCSVAAPTDQIFDPASTAVQPTGSVSYQCNFIGNTSLRLWSQNGGQVISPAAAQNGNVAQSRIYNMTFDGAALGQLTTTANAATPTVRPVTAANTNQLGATTIQLTTAANIAGAYSDTIFVDITP